MIGEVILIGDITTLLDYGYQYIGSLHILHIMDNRSQTQAWFRCYLHKV